MAASLRRAHLFRQTVLDKNKRPTVHGKPVYLKEQVVDSNGKVVKTKIRRFPQLEEK